MDEDRFVPAGKAEFGDHPLRLAQRVGADHVAALREQFDRVQQPPHLVFDRRVAEHRQAERRLGDEHVARDRLERAAGRVGAALVVAGDDDPPTLVLHQDLGAAQDVAGRQQGHVDLADPDGFAVGGCLLQDSGTVAQPGTGDCQRLLGRQHGVMAGAGMVAVAMGDHRTWDAADRVDVEIARHDVEPFRPDLDPALRVHPPISHAAGASLAAPAHVCRAKPTSAGGNPCRSAESSQVRA